MSSADPTASSPDPRRGRRIAAVVGGALGVIVVGGYVAGYLGAGDQVPRHATVAGVALGGLNRADAVTRLTTELGERSQRPIAVTVAGATEATAEIDPADAGLAVDYAASVDAAGVGKSLDPRHIWRVLTGGGPVDPVLIVDDSLLDTAVAAVAADVDRSPQDATLAISKGQATSGAGVAGVALDQDSARAAVRAGFLRDEPVALAATITPPQITDAEVTAVRADVVDPALAGPITLRVKEEGSVELTTTMIGQGIAITSADGTISATLDPTALRKAADSVLDDVEAKEPKDATVKISNGRPVVVPAVDGTTVAAADLAAAVQSVITANSDDRTAAVALSGAQADRSTADVERLGVKEVTGEFTTRFPYATYRNVNISRAAELIDNTLLEPGDTFSLNKIVGERTRANGFTEGNIISGGKFRLELGGGVSQSATTTYNAMFFAGLKDVQHQPHTLYIDRYPPGREATVAWPTVDLKFTNDTDYGVLVQASVIKATPSTQGSITVKMWSTKTYDKITSSELAKSNFTTGRDLEDDSPKCQEMSPVPGFDVNYTRIFSNGGKVVKTEKFFWRYAPTDRVRCS